MKRYLTEAQQRQLLDAPKRVKDLLAQRDYHWIAALILTGMRVTEFSRLTAPLVRHGLACGWLVSLKEHCKGRRKTNEYLVTNPLRKHLEALLAISDELAASHELAEGEMQPLIWGRDIAGQAGAMSVRSYQARLKGWAVVANLDSRISPHWLRHTRGMNVMRRSRGKDALRVAKLALNHDSIRSTGIYTQMNREEYEHSIRLVDGGRVPRRVAVRMAEQAVM